MELLKDESFCKWAVLGATIAALEFTGEQTLTNGFHRAMEHPIGRVVCIGGLAITASHLLGYLPRRFDPYYLFGFRD